jgi:hypothetical protein
VKGLSDFEMRFQYTGTRDYTPFAGIEAALEFRKLIGEEAVVNYNHQMALWAQRYLARLWQTETLVPEANTVAMGHVRLPIRTREAAAKLAELLKERHELHVMLFTLPAPGGRGADTYWVRPCFQIYNSSRDVELLGQYVLALAPLANVAALAGWWLARVRPAPAPPLEAEDDDDDDDDEGGGIWFERAPPSHAAAQPLFGQTPPRQIGFTERMNQAAANITKQLQRAPLKPVGVPDNPFTSHSHGERERGQGRLSTSSSASDFSHLQPHSPISVLGGQRGSFGAGLPRGAARTESWGSLSSLASSSTASLADHHLMQMQ